jgi:hypothetical protein
MVVVDGNIIYGVQLSRHKHEAIQILTFCGWMVTFFVLISRCRGFDSRRRQNYYSINTYQILAFHEK